jgi:hypothetical protein
MQSRRIETATAVKCGALVLAAMAVALPMIALVSGGPEGAVVRSSAISIGLLFLSGAMLLALSRAFRDVRFDDGLSANPFAPAMGVDLSQAAKAPAVSGPRESRWPERPSAATRSR